MFFSSSGAILEQHLSAGAPPTAKRIELKTKSKPAIHTAGKSQKVYESKNRINRTNQTDKTKYPIKLIPFNKLILMIK
jgi:hypothetical protein